MLVYENAAVELMNGFMTETRTTCTPTLYFIRYKVQPLVNTNKLIRPTQHNTTQQCAVVSKTDCWKFKAGITTGKKESLRKSHRREDGCLAVFSTACSSTMLVFKTSQPSLEGIAQKRENAQLVAVVARVHGSDWVGCLQPRPPESHL